MPSPAMQEILINSYKYQAPNISVAVGGKVTSWLDAAYTNQWFQRVKAKIGNYGLDYPYLSGKLTPDKAIALEEKLYNVFKEKLSG
mmetsp:Transcript_23248/g.3818  ORF Transcript_23248/g.3818 Transcript_23248/m.3818 type:complete len:86 (-) Transcript_23248:33-290(-)